MSKKKELRLRVWSKFFGHCAYCGQPIEPTEMQIDHIKPKALGGGNEFENLNPSCRSCNFYKADFTLDAFRGQLSTLIERLRKPFIVRLAERYGIIEIKPFSGEFYFERVNKTRV